MTHQEKEDLLKSDEKAQWFSIGFFVGAFLSWIVVVILLFVGK